MSLKVVLAKAHLAQLEDADIKREFESISEQINKVEIAYSDNAVNFVFVKGIYKHSERKMITVCLFVNKTGKAITELHGELKLRFNNCSVQIAKAIVDFDEPFLGNLKHDEALLVHFGIPVKGLTEDKIFEFKNMSGSLDNVRVTNA